MTYGGGVVIGLIRLRQRGRGHGLGRRHRASFGHTHPLRAPDRMIVPASSIVAIGNVRSQGRSNGASRAMSHRWGIQLNAPTMIGVDRDAAMPIAALGCEALPLDATRIAPLHYVQ
jgi:hypothetical protein